MAIYLSSGLGGRSTCYLVMMLEVLYCSVLLHTYISLKFLLVTIVRDCPIIQAIVIFGITVPIIRKISFNLDQVRNTLIARNRHIC